jgi:hypothetical protein
MRVMIMQERIKGITLDVAVISCKIRMIGTLMEERKR